MATWREIVQWDNSVFDEAIDLLLSSHNTGEEVHVELTRHDLSQWTGLGGDAARERLADVALRVEHLYSSTNDFVAALADAQDGVGQVEHLVANAQTLIDKYGFTLDPVTAEVSDPLIDFLKSQARQAASGVLSDSARSVNDRWIEISIRKNALELARESIQEALQKANEVGEQLRERLERVVEFSQWQEIADSLSIIDQINANLLGWPFEGLALNPSPVEVAVWADTQDEQTLLELAEQHPELVGNLDGLHGFVRDHANRIWLDREIDRVEEEYQEALDELWKYGDYIPNEFIELSNTRSELSNLKEALGPARSELTDAEFALNGRQLLVFEPPTGEGGHKNLHAAVAVGDIDTADHIAVNVPGTGSTVDGSIDGETQRMADLRNRSHLILEESGRSGESVATVAYLGYDAPPWLWDAIAASYADNAGQDLANFVEGIHYNREVGGDDNPRLTLMGHSYGSTTAGVGLNQTNTEVVDAFIPYGTPGLVDGGLSVPDDERYLVQHDSDIIEDANSFFGGAVHGYHPESDTSFTNVDPGQPAEMDGAKKIGAVHSSYLVDGSESQSQIARVVIGEKVDVR